MAVLSYRGSMARLSRVVVLGYPHHVTNRGIHSLEVFHSEGVRGEHLGLPGEENGRPADDGALVTTGVRLIDWNLSKGPPRRQRNGSL